MSCYQKFAIETPILQFHFSSKLPFAEKINCSCNIKKVLEPRTSLYKFNNGYELFSLFCFEEHGKETKNVALVLNVYFQGRPATS